MNEELADKNEELLRYQEEISSLLSQIVDLQYKIKEVCVHATHRESGLKVRQFVALKGWWLLLRIF